MPPNWKTYRIEEIAKTMADSPFGSNLKTKDYVESGIPVVQGKNINGRTCQWTGNRFVTTEKFQSLKRHHAKLGALVFPKVGTIGKVGLLTPYENQTDYILSTNTMMLEVNPIVASNDFVYYYFTSDEVVKHIQASNSNSVQPVFNYGSLKNYPIKLPPLPEQQSIASILSALDDKIELNLATNRTLEQMAMALYKHWFVDFCPFQEGNFIDSELGLIPEGWEVKRLDHVLEIKYGKDHKKLPDGDIPLYGSGGIMRFVNQHLYDQESILIPRKGTLSNLFYLREPFWSVDTMFYSKVRLPNYGKYVFHFLKTTDLASMDVGSAIPSLTTELLNRIELIIPDQQIIDRFDAFVTGWFNQMDANKKENQTLITLRDTLLPKLISGAVRVKDAERTVAHAL